MTIYVSIEEKWSPARELAGSVNGSYIAEPALACADLAPCDFFLWRFIKSKIYATKSCTVEELEGKVKRAFEEEISSDMCRNVMESQVKRLQVCLQKNGNQVESSI